LEKKKYRGNMKKRDWVQLCICAFTVFLMAIVWPFVASGNPLFFGWMSSMLLFHFIVFTIWTVSWGLYLFLPEKAEKKVREEVRGT
jgi:hypothetical protein